MLDFNNVKHTPKRYTPAIEIKGALLSRIESVLAHLFPDGCIRDGEFQVGDISGNPGNSLRVGLDGCKAGLWYDFATNEGGDIFDLWAARHGLDVKEQFLTVAGSAAQWLGTGSYDVAPINAKSVSKPSSSDLGVHTGKWDYTDTEGSLIACVYRYDTPNGKEYRPWDVVKRKCSAPTPRPLYNQVGMKDSDYVVLVEGEKAADSLISQGVVSTTAMQGANALPDKTDWTPLSDKKYVYVWPDNDKAGVDYGLKISQFIAFTQNVFSISLISIPEDKPLKWDAADAVADGMKNIDLQNFIVQNKKELL